MYSSKYVTKAIIDAMNPAYPREIYDLKDHLATRRIFSDLLESEDREDWRSAIIRMSKVIGGFANLADENPEFGESFANGLKDATDIINCMIQHFVSAKEER